MAKTAIVTGGNTGIGLETAVALAEKGFHVVIGCRSVEKGTQAVETITSRVPGSQVEAKALDLAHFDSIRAFAQDFLNKKSPIDVLVNNAGVMACPRAETKDGLELQMGTNHFGHFLLTSLLYPLIKAHESEARIVTLSSSGHQTFAKKGINLEDINSKQSYSRWPAYGQSKLANVLFTYELTRRMPKEDNITANAVHPGVVSTDLGRHLVPENSNFIWRGMSKMASRFFKTAAQGALTSVYVATSPDVAGISGKYYADCKSIPSSKVSYNEEDAKKLWNLSNEITGAKWDF